MKKYVLILLLGSMLAGCGVDKLPDKALNTIKNDSYITCFTEDTIKQRTEELGLKVGGIESSEEDEDEVLEDRLVGDRHFVTKKEIEQTKVKGKDDDSDLFDMYISGVYENTKLQGVSFRTEGEAAGQTEIMVFEKEGKPYQMDIYLNTFSERTDMDDNYIFGKYTINGLKFLMEKMGISSEEAENMLKSLKAGQPQKGNFKNYNWEFIPNSVTNMFCSGLDGMIRIC